MQRINSQLKCHLFLVAEPRYRTKSQQTNKTYRIRVFPCFAQSSKGCGTLRIVGAVLRGLHGQCRL
jgi:hypothetical protein